MSLEIFHEKFAEGLLASAGMEIQVQSQTSSPAGRFVGRDHSAYRIPATHVKLEGKFSAHFPRVQREANTRPGNLSRNELQYTAVNAI